MTGMELPATATHRHLDASGTHPTSADRARQVANLLGAAAQIAATAFVIATGLSRNFSGQSAGGDPPLTPAGWAFSIWGPIYAGSFAYAVVQALPRYSARDDFRRAGWGTAVAFFATAAWLLLAIRPTLAWGTVAAFAVIAAGLLVAMRHLGRDVPRSPLERWLVRAPLGVFLGWTSVAIFANTGAVLRATGVTRAGAETGVSLALLAVGTAIAAAIVRWSRGNGWYAATVLWALVGIVVANATGERGATNPVVAGAAALAAVLVAAVLAAARRARGVVT